jgi:hypothetical protein
MRQFIGMPAASTPSTAVQELEDEYGASADYMFSRSRFVTSPDRLSFLSLQTNTSLDESLHVLLCYRASASGATTPNDESVVRPVFSSQSPYGSVS